MSLRPKHTIIILAMLLVGLCSSVSLAQDGAGAPDGMPNPVTDTSLVLDSEAPTGPTKRSTDIPSVSDSTTDIRIVSGGGNTAFLLVVMLALFGLYLYNNQNMVRRISRLEEALRGRADLGRERDELVPFSWNSVLRSLEGGFDILPGLVVPQPCVVLLGNEKSEYIDSQRQRLVLTSNALQTIFKDQELVVLAALHHLGSSELGHQILTQLCGKRWELLNEDQRRDMLHNQGQELDHVSKSLYCLNDLVLTPVQLFQTCQDVLRGNDLGAVILDDLAVLVPDEQLSATELDRVAQQRDICESLRLLAVRCHVPVCVITETDSPTWNTLLEMGIPSVVARLNWKTDEVRATFAFDGAQDAVKVWDYEEQLGRLAPRPEGA